MSPGSRVPADKAARRINAAVRLLARGTGLPEAARQLALRHGISERQAHRYLRRARQGEVGIPRPKAAFTVKLTVDLIERVRRKARRDRRPVSAMVTQALLEFLERPDGGAP